MTERLTYVHIEIDGKTCFVGRLWTHSRKDRESASFEYDKGWLAHPERFSLEPALSLTPGTFHTASDKSLFGAIGDSAPDRWGRILMRRALNHQMKIDGFRGETLHEIDYLLAVSDESRQGALRFSKELTGPYLAPSEDVTIPPCVDLSKLLHASEKIIDDKESYEDIRLLLAPGSSLGGARPKASIRERDGSLSIAKFSQRGDEFSIVEWEALSLTLAERAGLFVPKWRLNDVSDKKVLILKRFDRENESRIPYLSAMSMLGANDNETHSYLEIVDALRQYGSEPKKDIEQLWKRIVFSILISNTDDHLRNHGFLFEGVKGWRLSPVFDINPTPITIRKRFLTTLIDLRDSRASLDLALSVADEFSLKQKEAKGIANQVALAVKDWRNVAKKLGIHKNEIERMSSAFEHKDLTTALNHQ